MTTIVFLPGESRPVSQQQATHTDSTKRDDRTMTKNQADKRKRNSVQPGNTMHIVGGTHAGMACQVITLLPREEGRSERATVRLLSSYETVNVRCSNLQDEKIEKEKKAREERKIDGHAAKNEMHERPWLVANVRVKVVDKKVEKGRFYLKKGRIVDVKTPTVCDVFIEDVQETVLVCVGTRTFN